MWTIVKVISKGDYNYCLVEEDHPNSTANGYILHHRIVMENKLGRLLTSDEVVHHLNDIKKDNRPENLEVMLKGEHARLHSSTGRAFVLLRCPQCGIIFERERKQTHLSKGGTYTACSRSCSGRFSHADKEYNEDNILHEYIRKDI